MIIFEKKTTYITLITKEALINYSDIKPIKCTIFLRKFIKRAGILTQRHLAQAFDKKMNCKNKLTEPAGSDVFNSLVYILAGTNFTKFFLCTGSPTLYTRKKTYL